jgi:predicted transcriptional regulator YdeE
LDPGAKDYRNFDGYKPYTIPKALKIIRGYKEDQKMESVEMSSIHVELVKLEEKNFVGVAVTSSFQNVTGIGEASKFFMERKSRIQSVVNEDEYVCLHFSNDVVFTYIYCIEVLELKSIPDGMIGFNVPSSRYAKVRTKDEDPYGLINTYLKEKVLESNPKLFAFEVFRFGEEENKYNADILVPIMN